jgi:uncharacterized protein (TIGR02996 family)
MTATDPTYAALLAGVLAAPEDDVPRLVAADWLEENGEPERAEFIRCQIEILRLQMQGTPSVYYPDEPDAPEKLNALRRRERELLDAHRMDWFAIPGLQRPWSNAKDDVVWATGSGRGYELYFGGKVRRGFIESVTCDLATLFGGGVCENCGGDGEFTRENSDGPSGPCPECGGKWNSGPHFEGDSYWDRGTGRTPGIAPRLFASQPVTRVTLTDAVVYPSGGNDTYYLGSLGHFPSEYWRSLENLPSRRAVMDATSAVCVAYGRARAGLPPLARGGAAVVVARVGR